jgi:hypothetical protein
MPEESREDYPLNFIAPLLDADCVPIAKDNVSERDAVQCLGVGWKF